MAIQRKKADVVIVGLGWAGSLMAEHSASVAELRKALGI